MLSSAARPSREPRKVALARLDEAGELLQLRARRWRPACRSPSGCSRCASRCTCGRSRAAARRAASRTACRRCWPCPDRTSSRGPSRGTSSTSFLSSGWSVSDRAAFAHRDVVRGIEAEGGQIAERARLPAAVAGAERVAVVLDQPEVVPLRRTAVTASRSKGLPSVWAIMMARVRGPIAAFELRRRRRCRCRARHRRRPERGRSGGSGLTVVGKPAATVITSSPGRSRRSPSFGEVRADSARRLAEEPELHSRACAAAETARELPLELRGEAPRRQPEIERGVDQVATGRRRRRPARDRNRRVSRHKRALRPLLPRVFGDEGEDPLPQELRLRHGEPASRSRYQAMVCPAPPRAATSAASRGGAAPCRCPGAGRGSPRGRCSRSPAEGRSVPSAAGRHRPPGGRSTDSSGPKLKAWPRISGDSIRSAIASR